MLLAFVTKVKRFFLSGCKFQTLHRKLIAFVTKRHHTNLKTFQKPYYLSKKAIKQTLKPYYLIINTLSNKLTKIVKKVIKLRCNVLKPFNRKGIHKNVSFVLQKNLVNMRDIAIIYLDKNAKKLDSRYFILPNYLIPKTMFSDKIL